LERFYITQMHIREVGEEPNWNIDRTRIIWDNEIQLNCKTLRYNISLKPWASSIWNLKSRLSINLI
jgi:hypothetical protein